MTRLTQIDQAPPIGRFLHDLVQERLYDDFFPLDDAADLERPKLFFPDPPETGVGTMGQYMVNPAFRRYHVDPIAAYAFEDVVLLGGDGVVVLPSGVLRNTLDYVNPQVPSSNVQVFRRNEELTLRRPMPVSRAAVEGRLVIGYTGAWRDWRHWVSQCLPKLFAFSLLRRRFRTMKVALPPLPPGSPHQRTLDLLGIGPDAVQVVPLNDAVGFDMAIVLPNFDLWNVPPFAAQAADRLIDAVPAAVRDAPGRPERIYVRRPQAARTAINAEAVDALAARHGFVPLVFEEADLADRIAAMQAARHVLIDQGAASSDVMFCREGARVLEIMNPVGVQPTTWCLAARRGVAYGYVVAAHHPTRAHPDPSANGALDVPLDRLEAAVQALTLGQPAPAALAVPPPALRAAAPAAVAAPTAVAAQTAVAAPPPPVQQAAPVPPSPQPTATAMAAPRPAPAPQAAAPPPPAAAPVPPAAAPVPAPARASYSGIAEPIFELTADLGSFGVAAQHQRLLMFPAILPPPQRPMHRQADIRADFVAEHMHYPPPAGVHVYAVRDGVIWGNGLVTVGSQFLAPPDCIPAYFRPHMQPGGPAFHPVHAGALNKEQPETLALDVPVASVMHPNIVYGHFLLEMLPRLYLLHLLRQFGLDVPMVLSTTVLPWVKRFISILQPQTRIIPYDAATQCVTAPCLILPSMMHHDHNFHPAFNMMIDELVRRAGPAPDGSPAMIYLSRTNYAEERIENEDEVAQAMADLGFTVVRPHEMAPDAQIRLFASATVIAGEYGSALHNAIFSPVGATVIALNFFNNYQSKIARVRGHRMAYVPPSDGVFRHWRLTADRPRKFRIDIGQLRQTVSEMVG